MPPIGAAPTSRRSDTGWRYEGRRPPAPRLTPGAMDASRTLKGCRMAEKRRALGRGLGALIPSAPTGGAGRPVDVFFTEQKKPEPAPVEMTHDSAPATAESPLMTD